ncbi:glycosyltransferase family 2 protein [Catenovulum sediminis]|uniref:glycosyltransferase family 2 protein n=1 Tax=Catenovulum sediminis TaxID=1740262 RepID=UPI00117DD8D2|nr:glycosyltransferase [Catenovulum sediminis]
MPKISVVTPYARRIKSIHYMLKGLSQQTMANQDFEIVIACLEHSDELYHLIKTEFADLNIILVMADISWNVSKARNMALKVASGDYIVLLDADMVVPHDCLEQHHLAHLASKNNKLVVGQMRDYDERKDIEEYSYPSFAHYVENFLAKSACQLDLEADIRWTIDVYIDWALGWTAIMSLPKTAMLENNLFFDEEFIGWGVEDLDWALRVTRANVEIEFSDKIWSIHLPHPRNVAENQRTEYVNFQRLLHKFPESDVEVVVAFGDVAGNQRYLDYLRNAKLLQNNQYTHNCVAEFTSQEGQLALLIGACTDEQGNLDPSQVPVELNPLKPTKTLPLLGIALPYSDKSITQVFYTDQIAKLDNAFQNKISQETKRIST